MAEFSTSSPNRKFWAGLGLAALAFGTFHGAVHSQAPTLAEMPAFEVGDKWTFLSQNKGDRKEPYLVTQQAFKIEAGSGWVYFDSKNPQAIRNQGIHRFDYKRGDVKESFTYDAAKPDLKGKRYFNGQPSDDIFQLPLVVGKKYGVKWDWNNGDGFDEYNVEVEAFEKVKTEAGEFDAYRVNMAGYWNRTRADANGWTGSGKHGRTYWYAPAIKTVVKTETFNRTSRGSPWNEFVSELVKFEPRAPLDAALTPVTAKPAATVSTPAVTASQ